MNVLTSRLRVQGRRLVRRVTGGRKSPWVQAVALARPVLGCGCSRALRTALTGGLGVCVASDPLRVAPDAVRVQHCACGLWFGFLPAVTRTVVYDLDAVGQLAGYVRQQRRVVRAV